MGNSLIWKFHFLIVSFSDVLLIDSSDISFSLL